MGPNQLSGNAQAAETDRRHRHTVPGSVTGEGTLEGGQSSLARGRGGMRHASWHSVRHFHLLSAAHWPARTCALRAQRFTLPCACMALLAGGGLASVDVTGLVVMQGHATCILARLTALFASTFFCPFGLKGLQRSYQGERRTDIGWCPICLEVGGEDEVPLDRNALGLFRQ